MLLLEKKVENIKHTGSQNKKHSDISEKKPYTQVDETCDDGGEMFAGREVCLECFFLASCPGAAGTSQNKPTETTGRRAPHKHADTRRLSPS